MDWRDIEVRNHEDNRFLEKASNSCKSNSKLKERNVWKVHQIVSDYKRWFVKGNM